MGDSQDSPATATHVTGSNHYALLTTVARMGAGEPRRRRRDAR